MRTAFLAALTLAAATFGANAAALDAKANAAFLAANAKKSGVVQVPGIQYRVIAPGKGAQPDRHDCATVTYKGSFVDGKVFDATKPGETATFPVGAVIAGWTEALQMMHEGEEWELVIPPGLAYGHAGAGQGVIPPDQILIFDVKLVKISKPFAGACLQK